MKEKKLPKPPRDHRPFIKYTDSDGNEVAPVSTLRVFVGNNYRRHFVEFYIWRYLWQMRAQRRTKKYRRKTLGFFNEYHEVRTVKNRKGHAIGGKKLGDVHLALPTLSYQIIAHECWHVTSTYARRAGNKQPQTPKAADAEFIDGADCAEEKNARFHGWLVDAVVSHSLRIINEGRTRKSCQT